jgi:hypothetical protein
VSKNNSCRIFHLLLYIIDFNALLKDYFCRIGKKRKQGVRTMEIIIGSIPPLQAQSTKASPKASSLIEAQLLNVRPPRKGIAGPSGRERRVANVKDPHSGRVLTVMVPDASLLPADINTSKYDVSIRLIRRE